MRLSFVYALLFILLAISSYALGDMTLEEREAWFDNDEIAPALPTSEGELKFLTELPHKPPTHSYNKITISERSIKTGWVELYQCYSQLDPVSETVIAYQYKTMRSFVIQSKNNIGEVTIKGQSVELIDVQKMAKLCISAEIKIFYQNKKGRFSLVNGPFHRKFLDSYFPYKVTLDIDYPSSKIQFVKSVPASQKGFHIEQKQNNLFIESLFVGKLNTKFEFELK